MYDKLIGFSDEWTVHRFHIPDVTTGSKVLDINLPYSPPAIGIGKIDERTLQASNGPKDPVFGSFVEITRAGGAFAFLSGGWEAGFEDNDSSNQGGEKDVEKVTEYSNVSKRPIRDGGMVAEVIQPEVGLIKGGWVPHGNDAKRRRAGVGKADQLMGSFRTWLQMQKTISFPASSQNEILDVVISLVPLEGGAACAASLNKNLSGPGGRPLKPKHSITDDEVRRKLGIIGVNFDSTLAFSGPGTNVEAGFRLCTVKGGSVGSYNKTAGNISILRNQVNVFTTDVTFASGGSQRFQVWEATGGVGLKFRLEAFYDFSIETSGIDHTPFAIYVRGRLDKAHLEVRSGPRPSFLNPRYLPEMAKMANFRCFAFDYDGVGRTDHIVGYVPGSRILFYGREGARSIRFTPHYDKDGCYDLLRGANLACNISKTEDRALAFDYDRSGKLDHLVVYSPGKGAITIFRRQEERHFKPVFNSTTGIAGYDLLNPADRAFAFDYAGSGKLDHLVFYRLGSGEIVVIKNVGPPKYFEEVYRSTGICGNDLKGSGDRVFAFDYAGTGKLDHLVFRRPGSGEIAILKNVGPPKKFEEVSRSRGIADSTGKTLRPREPCRSRLCLRLRGCRKNGSSDGLSPWHGCVLHRQEEGGMEGKFEALPGWQGHPGGGIAGYDLKSPADRGFAFDYDGSGRFDHLVFYRPGSGDLVVLKKRALKPTWAACYESMVSLSRTFELQFAPPSRAPRG